MFVTGVRLYWISELSQMPLKVRDLYNLHLHMLSFMHVSGCVCMCVCIGACVFALVHVCLHWCMCVCIGACVCESGLRVIIADFKCN